MRVFIPLDHKEQQMTCRNNLTPKVTVVVSTPDSGKHRCRKQLPRVKGFNSTAESYVLGARHNFTQFGDSR